MKTSNLLFNGQIYQCQPEETVLDALLRQKVEVPFMQKTNLHDLHDAIIECPTAD